MGIIIYMYVPNPGSHDSLPKHYIDSESHDSDFKSYNK